MSSPETLEAREIANLANILPPEENEFTVSGARIPMADGIELVGDLYRPNLPEGTNPLGLIYVLTPYGRKGLMALLNAKCFAARGYIVLLVSCRGTAGSGGIFAAGMSEQVDSQAVVRWMREQPWYPGEFVTFGPSYLGYVQWALLRDPPKDLVASIILCSVYDQSLLTWTNGMYRMDRISWSYVVSKLDEPDGGLSNASDLKKIQTTINSTPIYDATENLLDGRAPYVLKGMATPNVEDPFWASCKHRDALDLVNSPLLLRSGWYDTLTLQTMEAYRHVRDRGLKVYLTIGPWTHTEACGSNAIPEVLDFLDEYVAGRKKDHRPLPTKIFVTGAEEWRYLPSWPPATEGRDFYFHSDKSVSSQPPAPNSPPVSFVFDPNNPTPTLGGPRMARGGRVDDSAYASRSDVLVYTSEPLAEEVEFMGRPIVQLAHSTDLPYADLWIRLSEVDSSGVSHNLTENWEALHGSGQREAAEFSLALADRAHVFKKGTCIRVVVAGGSFPLLARNPGTGENRTLANEFKAVKHTIQHGGGISKLILPCPT